MQKDEQKKKRDDTNRICPPTEMSEIKGDGKSFFFICDAADNHVPSSDDLTSPLPTLYQTNRSIMYE